MWSRFFEFVGNFSWLQRTEYNAAHFYGFLFRLMWLYLYEYWYDNCQISLGISINHNFNVLSNFMQIENEKKRKKRKNDPLDDLITFLNTPEVNISQSIINNYPSNQRCSRPATAPPSIFLFLIHLIFNCISIDVLSSLLDSRRNIRFLTLLYSEENL